MASHVRQPQSLFRPRAGGTAHTNGYPRYWRLLIVHHHPLSISPDNVSVPRVARNDVIVEPAGRRKF